MIVLVIKVKIHIYECQSLKEKRSIIKSLISKLSNKFNISISEVGDNDMLKSSTLGIAAVSSDKSFLQSIYSKVTSEIDKLDNLEKIDFDTEYLHL